MNVDNSRDLCRSLDAMGTSESSTETMKHMVVEFQKARCSLTLTNPQYEALIKKAVFVIKTTENDELLIEACENIVYFLHLDVVKAEQISAFTLSGLTSWIESNGNRSMACQSSVLKCIKHLVRSVKLEAKSTEELVVLIMNNAIEKSLQQTEFDWSNSTGLTNKLMWAKFFLASLRTIYSILKNSNLSGWNQNLGALLGFFKTSMFCGLPGYDIYKQKYSALYSSPLGQYVPAGRSVSTHKPKNSIKNRRRQVKSNQSAEKVEEGTRNFGDGPGSLTSPSDSDTASLVPPTTDVSFLKKIIWQNEMKIRMMSYENLTLMVKIVDNRTLFGYWSSFIPDTSATLTTELNILFSILKDPSPKVRSAAICFLRELVESGREFLLSLAEDNKRTSQHPFTTISQTFAGTLYEVHRGMESVLFAENNPIVLQHALKCVSVLISATPYHKLRYDLLSSTLNKVTLLFDRDSQIQNSVLALFVSVFSKSVPSEALLSWLQSNDGKKHMEHIVKFATGKVNCYDCFNLCAESMKFLSLCLKTENTSTYLEIPTLMDLLLDACSAEVVISNPVLQSHLCKAVNCMAWYLKSPEATKISTGAKAEWWTKLAQSALFAELNRGTELIHVSCVTTLIDSLSHIDKTTFDSFPPRFRFYILSLIFSKCTSEDAATAPCASALRCLGVFLEHSFVSDDISCVLDIFTCCDSLIRSLSETQRLFSSHHQTVYQLSWTFANVQDVAIKFFHDSEELRFDFAVTSFSLCRSLFAFEIPSVLGWNVKTNTVRSLSSLIQLILHVIKNDLAHKTECKQMVLDATDLLVTSLTKWQHFKLHWNIFYAFSILFPMEDYVYIISSDLSNSTMINNIVKVALKIIDETKNFKVQAYAINALCCMQQEKLYSEATIEQIYGKIVDSLLQNFSNVPETTKPMWLEKILKGLSNLTNLMQAGNHTNFISSKKHVLKEFLLKIQLDENMPKIDPESIAWLN